MLLRTGLYLFKSLHYCEISAAKHTGVVAECQKTSECILGLENARLLFICLSQFMAFKNEIQKKSKKPLEVLEDVYKGDTVMFCITT